MAQPRVLAFAGSSRRDSYNAQLIEVAAEGARSAGAEVTVINLASYELPLFNEDLEAAEGAPVNATRLKELFFEHDGLLIASPEYNSSISPLLKNTIDWVSRAAEGEGSLAAYQGKVAAIMAASPGALGGLRGLVHVRSILSSIGVLVVPNQIAIPRAFEAFGEDGRLRDERQQAKVEAIGAGLATTLQKLTA